MMLILSGPLKFKVGYLDSIKKNIKPRQVKVIQKLPNKGSKNKKESGQAAAFTLTKLTFAFVRG